MTRWIILLVQVVALVLTNACGLPPPAARDESTHPFREGSYEDAARDMPIAVPRLSSLPSAARPAGVEYSNRGRLWAVQRFVVGENTLYVKTEPVPRDFAPPYEAEVVVQGLRARVAAFSRPDGGIDEWRVFLLKGALLHTIAGDLSVETLLDVAAGLRLH